MSPDPPSKCTLCTPYEESPKLKANNFGLDSPSYYNISHKDIKTKLLNDRGFIYLSSPPKCTMSIMRTKWLRLSDISTVLCQASKFHVIGSDKFSLSIPTSESIDLFFSLSEKFSGAGSDLSD